MPIFHCDKYISRRVKEIFGVAWSCERQSGCGLYIQKTGLPELIELYPAFPPSKGKGMINANLVCVS